MKGLFVTGTDTGVGKTAVSAALLAAMRETGQPVAAFKPAVTGLDEDSGQDGWPADHELLAREAGMAPDEVAPHRFGPATSPHLAAALAGAIIDPGALIARAQELASERALIAEGVGGLLVPLTRSFSVCDLTAELGLPLLVVARAGLGTINHTLLTLRAARGRGIDVRAVVLNRWPDAPDVIERSNRETIEQIGAVPVVTLGELPSAAPDVLAAAGGTLPWQGWLGTT